MDELSELEAAFCEQYIVDLNGAAAARRAGYSPAAAKEIGYRLLTRAHVRAEVDRLKTERSESTRIKAEDVIRELAKISHSNMMNYVRKVPGGYAVVDLEHVDHDLGAAISEMTVESYVEGRGEDGQEVRRVKIKLSDKLRALEMLGRHLALFTDKAEVKVVGDVAEILQRRRQQAGMSEEEPV